MRVFLVNPSDVSFGIAVITPRWLFVLAAAVIVGNAIVVALLDPSQFKNLAVAIILFVLGLPAYFFWRKRAIPV